MNTTSPRKIEVPPGRYDGFIFDLDGTIADSMPIHFKAWTETIERKSDGPSRFTENIFYSYGGRPPREIISSLNDDYGYALPVNETATEKEARFVELMHEVQPIAPVVEFLRGLPVEAKKAVASGGLHEIVERTLQQLGVRDLIQAIVGADDVLRGKPDPEGFNKAAALIGVPAHRILVLEDAEPGMAAARAAGMDFLDVRPYYLPPEKLALMQP
jgi:HAD superfamily hydrolase (TIGR01509 family)